MSQAALVIGMSALITVSFLVLFVVAYRALYAVSPIED